MRSFLVVLATVSLVKGDERKAFMSSCLKAGAPAAPMT
jgi:hypothetical protein